jgi:hypothetical protein
MNGSLTPNTTTSDIQRYNSWYAAVRFNHQMRPATNFFLSYGVGLQATNATGCTSPSCATNFISHQISGGFNFGLRPIVMR